MPENPSEHTNDEKQLPKTSSEFGGDNWFPPNWVTASDDWDDSDDDNSFKAHLEKVHLEYVAACEECNRRLRQIAALLERGLHTEAMQEALKEPALKTATSGNILEWVAELDFPLLEEWCDLLSCHGLIPPPKLEIEIAQRLNAAIGDGQSGDLRELERRHRLLPLAGAPIQQRIDILRHLHKLQPDNTTWIRQLELLEKARHQELPAELQAAMAAGELKVVEDLLLELEYSDWKFPPEAGTVNLARKLKQALSDKLILLDLLQLKGVFAYGSLLWHETKRTNQRLDAIEARLKELTDPTPSEDNQ